MAFLLGLFIGATIFILGYGFGMGRDEKDRDEEYTDSDGNSVIYCVFPSFEDFVEEVLDCQKKGVPLNLSVSTQDRDIDIVITDQRMHAESSFNIDNEG